MKNKYLYTAIFLVVLLFMGIAPDVAQTIEPPVASPDIYEEPTLPGTLESTGTFFEVMDSEYINVTLQSSESISLALVSIPSMVMMNVEAAEGASSTQMTLGGLAPLTTYYMYEDSYANKEVITTDENGSYSWEQDLSAPHHVWLQPDPSTKFIWDNATGGDCISIGTWNSASKTCTLNTDLYETIEILSDNITLDGAGYTIQGVGSGNGVYLYRRTGVTIKNIYVTNFTQGIYLYFSSDITLTGITAVSNSSYGIFLWNSSSNTLTGNIASNNYYGIILQYSSSNTLTGNTASSNLFDGIYILSQSSSNTLTGNTTSSNGVNGIGISKSSDNTLTDNTASNNRTGISLNENSGSTLTGNTVSMNSQYGFFLFNTSHSILTLNTSSSNGYYGIFLNFDGRGIDTTDNQIYSNNFIDNTNQVYACPSSYCSNNIFNLDRPTGGNYWSNWTAPDIDADSFVDNPYVFSNNVDYLPLTVPNGNGNIDTDGDGVADSEDVCPGGDDNVDTDGDGTPDFCDECPSDNPDDFDGNGICDSDETPVCEPGCVNGECVDNGVCACFEGYEGDRCEFVSDGDGVPNDIDNCPDDPNTDQTDTDGDGIGDVCDNCAGASNQGQIDNDVDGIGDVCDNCAFDQNADQSDGDGDSVGDVCDVCPDDPLNDIDGDGVCGDVDVCPDDPAKTADAGQCGCGVAETDSDADGTADCNDQCVSDANKTEVGECGCGVADTDSDGDGTADCVDADDDNDGISDTEEITCASDPLNALSTCEVCDGVDNDLNDGIDEGFPNTDGDGAANCIDIDDDNDGISDVNETTCGSDPLIAVSTCEVCDGVDNDLNEGIDEGFTDNDNDGEADCVDTDDDNDGNTDDEEGACGSEPLNADSTCEECDGIDNDLNDGIDEGFDDTDSNGMADCIDEDDDDDGIIDDEEVACGSDPLNADSTCEECDGIDNDLNDGIDEGFDDTDSDGTADCVDTDDDDDGIIDDEEVSCNSDPLNAASTCEVCDGIDNDLNELIDEEYDDSDGDGISDCVDTDDDNDDVDDDQDNCPTLYNPAQEDLDGDNVGDACDQDADGDGDLSDTDCDDLDPSRYHGAVEICSDGIDNDCDELVDDDNALGDCDADGENNGTDNCLLDYNPGQSDLDNDGEGDTCDADDDNDSVDDINDNCPIVANADQSDIDGDGAGDVCDSDADGDGVNDYTGDLCQFTAPSDPDAGVPSRSLGKNRWADIDGDGTFDTNGKNPTGRSYDMADTSGCNCEQIIVTCGYGKGQTKFGCSNSVMDWWTGKFDREGEAPFQCKEN